MELLSIPGTNVIQLLSKLNIDLTNKLSIAQQYQFIVFQEEYDRKFW